MRFASFILGVILVLAAGSLPALANVTLFRTAVNYDAGTNPASVAVGDFDQDGSPDLAVANVAVAPLDGDKVSILLNKGDGTFQAAVNYGAGTDPNSVAVGDFNGDGSPDLAVSKYLSDKISILLNKGDGSGAFKAAKTYYAGAYASSVAVGDFNGDGHLDLAVANYRNNKVSVLLNTGDGTFQAAENYDAGTNPNSVAVGDFDQDGSPDLAVANYNSDSVSVLLGQGDGSFQAAVKYDAGTNPASVAVGEFNGDGQPDLAVANNNSDNVSVLLGQGDGTFQTAVNYGAGTKPISVAVGDFDGDGYPDLAVANYNSNDVSVLLNRSLGVGSLNLTGPIPDLRAGGSVYDLDSLQLTARNQLGDTMSIAGLPISWTSFGSSGRISGDHYLEPISSGAGAVTVTVDGVTSNPVGFNVQAYNNADLSALTVSPGSISSFDPDTVAYTVYNSGSPAGLSVTAIVYDSSSSLTIGGQPAQSTVAQAVYLDQGGNLIPIVVTAADGRTQKAYVLSVNGTVSDADLGNLSLSTGNIGFSPSDTNYSLTVAGTDSLTLIAGPDDPKALVLVDGSPLPLGGGSKTVNLDYGANSVEVTVVAQDATTKTYTIDVTRGRPPITWDAGDLQATNITATGLTLTWPAAASAAGISGYNVYRGTSLLSTVTASVYS